MDTYVIMDYKEKYMEALERAKTLYENANGMILKKWVEQVFPELKESEDARIRKALISRFNESGELDGISYDNIKIWLEKQGEPIDKGEISDGYHTFNELYYYRMLYNAAFFNLLPKELVHKSKRHHDGEECFGGGWFIVMANLPTGQISNHYELKDWDLFQIPEKEMADEWDGHTPQEAAERLHKYLEKQGGQKPANKVEPKFDVEKKELEKIENEIEIPFGAKDSELQEVVYNIPKGFYAEIEGDKVIIKKGKQKPAWSVEDTFKVQRICKYLDEAKKYYADITEVRECIDWLKSLRPQNRWKPSDEQMTALRRMKAAIAGEGEIYKPLNSLYEDLKKLREE